MLTTSVVLEIGLNTYSVYWQVEQLEAGSPGRYKVTGQYNDGTPYEDEFNTVSSALVDKKHLYL